MSRPGTCSAGYNSIRFDDVITRHLLYRNLRDAYEREYRNGNSRWDLIDLARMCYALRPDGIEWPMHEPGKPSFRLEDLSSANGIAHEGAHDALADVHATIGLARLLKNAQPKLFDWALQMRDYTHVSRLLDTVEPHRCCILQPGYPLPVVAPPWFCRWPSCRSGPNPSLLSTCPPIQLP